MIIDQFDFKNVLTLPKRNNPIVAPLPIGDPRTDLLICDDFVRIKQIQLASEPLGSFSNQEKKASGRLVEAKNDGQMNGNMPKIKNCLDNNMILGKPN